MEIGQIEAFVRVVTEGSITRAGVALQRNQSSISMRLAALEQSLGTALFERRGRTVVLTAAGRAFLPYAEKILELRAESIRETVSAATPLGGQVMSLGANNWSAGAILPRLAQDFSRRVPEAGLHIEVHSTPALVSLLGESKVEAAMLNPQLATQVFQQLALYEEPCVLVSKAPFPEAVSAAEIAEVPFLSYTAGPVRDMITRLQFQVGRELKIRALSNSAQLIRSFVDAELGVGFLPYSIIEGDLEDGRLHRIVISDFEPAQWPVSLVTVRGRRLSVPARTFVEMAANSLHELQRRSRPIVDAG